MADFEKVYSIRFNVGTAIKNLERLDKAVEKIEENRLVKVLSQVELKMKNISKQGAKTGRALDKAFDKRRATKKVKELKEESDKAAKSIKRLGKSGDGLKTLGTNLNRYVVLPLAAIGAASIKSSIELNKSMASVSTLLDEPIGKIDDLKRGVQDMAVETGKATDDLSLGLFQVISALGESEQNMGQLSIASKAAVAGVSTTADAINLLSAAGKGYNDVSEEALKKTSDLAFMTAKLGVTTFPEMAASMGKVIPLAAQFETSQEELFATMATLTGVTGNTAEVTTQLSSVYSAFMQPSEAMDNALKKINKQNKEYNFQTAGTMLKTLGFKKSIELMNDVAKGNEEQLGKIFKRKEAILGVLPLISTQSENYTEKLEAMRNATGATDEAFERQTNGINKQGHEWEKTKQRMIVFSQRLGDRLLPVLDRLLDAAEPIIQWLENLDEGSIDAAINVAGLVVQLTLGLKALNGINGVLGFVSSGITGVGNAASGATGKVASLTTKMQGLLGVAAALMAAYQALKFAEAGVAAAEKAELNRANTATQTARQLAGADLSKFSDKNIRSLRQLTSESVDAAKEEAEGVHFFQADRDASQAEFESTKSQLARIDAEIAARGTAAADPMGIDSGLPSAGARGGRRITGDNPFAGSGTDVFGGGGGQNINVKTGDTIINTGADAKSVSAELDKRDRRVKQDLKRAIGEAARGEQ
jgi:TP901 family phage tail tape measure protein